jgi:hypothetical protein
MRAAYIDRPCGALHRIVFEIGQAFVDDEWADFVCISRQAAPLDGDGASGTCHNEEYDTTG